MKQSSIRHVAFIMDGNRRWAHKNGDHLLEAQAAHAVREVTIAALEHAVTHLSLYAYSLENFAQRALTVRSRIFTMIARFCKEEQQFFLDNDIRVQFIGKRELYPSAARDVLEACEALTRSGQRLTLSVLLCYGGQQEIVSAACALAAQLRAGEVAIDEVTPRYFEHLLWCGDLPAPDLIVRTGGVQRLSNFFLYQAAYAELIFLDCLWPDIDRAIVRNCFETFHQRVRNFGS